MSVKFRCLLSNNIFEFHTDFDIETMREHPQYDELKELPNGVQTQKKQNTKEKVIKKEAK